LFFESALCSFSFAATREREKRKSERVKRELKWFKKAPQGFMRLYFKKFGEIVYLSFYHIIK
jgi:hypothetical protein